jgi:threonine dehydrogenase-like Zn-dependent dehydrogenase
VTRASIAALDARCNPRQNPLSDVAEAYDLFLGKRDGCVKIVLKP